MLFLSGSGSLKCTAADDTDCIKKTRNAMSICFEIVSVNQRKTRDMLCRGVERACLAAIILLILFSETKRNQARYDETKGIMQTYFLKR